MDFAELHDRIIAVLPEATFGEDNDGQLVIYTNLMETEDETLVSLDDA